MVGEITKQGHIESQERGPLLPDRYPTADLFVCDIFDAAPKSDMASMEHPIFSLSTKPDRRIRRYEHGKSYVQINPSVDGLATVHDRDVLIFCISQIMGALNAGKQVSQTVRLKAFDLLVATNRVTDGRGYEGLKAALKRLQGTQIETNLITGGQEQFERVIPDHTAVGEFDDGQAVVKDIEGAFLRFSGQYMSENEYRLSLTLCAEVS